SGFAEAGGLLAYGPSFTELFRRVGVLAGKVLNGTKPAELPVEQPTKYELVVNLATAKQIGVTIPQSLLFRANKVIKKGHQIRMHNDRPDKRPVTLEELLVSSRAQTDALANY